VDDRVNDRPVTITAAVDVLETQAPAVLKVRVIHGPRTTLGAATYGPIRAPGRY
jgi:hypothetical protein